MNAGYQVETITLANIRSELNEPAPPNYDSIDLCGAPASTFLNNSPDNSSVWLELRTLANKDELWDSLSEIFPVSCLCYLCYISASWVSSKILCGSCKVILLPTEVFVFTLMCFKYWGVIVIKESIFFKYVQFTWNREACNILENWCQKASKPNIFRKKSRALGHNPYSIIKLYIYLVNKH